jgi:hypothetical protein
MNFILHRKYLKILKKNLQKKIKNQKKLLVERYDEDSTRLLVTRLVMLSNISFFISVFTNHAVFDYPSFFEALHRPQGVRIGELEAIRRKYVNFLDFDFFLILLYAKKKQKNNKKKSSAVCLNRCSQPFGLTKLIC